MPDKHLLDEHLEPTPLVTPDTVGTTPTPIRLALHRYVGPAADLSAQRKPVLLLHGASANHRTFTVRNGGLAAWLAAKNYDPWLLDWRGSGLVGDDIENRPTLEKHGEIYNFNRAARHDIRLALDHIKQASGQDSKISVIGFCMGSTVLAEAIVLGHISHHDIDRVVLMTLGLVYQSPIDGRLKSEDRVLERARRPASGPPLVLVDPRAGTAVNKIVRPQWDDELRRIYDAWPRGLKAHRDDELSERERVARDSAYPTQSQARHLCNHVSFMYGMPYNHEHLVEEIHGDDGRTPMLFELFGAIPLHMLMHGAQNLRNGQASFYRQDAPQTQSAPKLTQIPDDARFLSDEARDAFQALDRVTLITGALNRLWHRDSIDRMYDWLRRGPAGRPGAIQKHVLPGYAHQDLLWGRQSAHDVFRKIGEALGQAPHNYKVMPTSAV